MKYLIISAVIAVAFCSCKKGNTEPAGSPYTNQVAGTREYRYEYDQHIGSWDSTTVDTVSVEIKYITPSSIKFNTTTLTYSQGQSNDSVLVFTDLSLPQLNSGILTYDRLTYKISYRISNYVSAGGQFYTVYTSL